MEVPSVASRVRTEADSIVVRRTIGSGIFYIAAFALVIATDERLMASTGVVAAWAAAFLVMYLLRFVSSDGLFYLSIPNPSPFFFGVVIANGAVWAAAVVWIFAEIREFNETTSLALAMQVAISSGALVSMFPLRWLMSAQLLALNVPLVMALPVLIPSVTSYVTTIALCIYVYYLYANGRFQNGFFTESVENRFRLEQQAEELTQAGLAKSNFLAHVSHELKTPLNGIVGMIQLLRKTRLEPRQDRYVDVIHQSSDILLRLIDDVLEYSEISRNNIQLEESVVDVREICSGIVDIFRHQMEDPENVLLRLTVEDDVPPAVRVDRLRLQQVLLNLISNAVKNTQEGLIELNVSIWSDQLRFHLSDTGRGMSVQQLSRVQDDFVRIDDGAKQVSGMGLGLTVCNRILSHMGTELNIESQPGKGSAFSFAIPIIR